jgi:hypothetical protein
MIMENNYINMDGSKLLIHENDGVEIRMIDDKGNVVFRHLSNDECWAIMKWIKDHKYKKYLTI